jgi:outer membrane protein W
MRDTSMTIVAPVLAALFLAGCSGGEEKPAAPSASDSHFRSGMWDVSISGNSNLHRISSNEMDHATTAELTPQVGYFLTDRFEVQAAIGAQYQDAHYEKHDDPLELRRAKQQDYLAALGFQYNFDNDGPVVPFVRAFGGVIDSHRRTIQTNIPMVGTAELNERDTAPYAGVRVGVRYFVTPDMTADVGLGWKRAFYDEGLGGNTDDTSLTLGVSLLF